MDETLILAWPLLDGDAGILAEYAKERISQSIALFFLHMPEHEPGAAEDESGLEKISFREPQRAKDNFSNIRKHAAPGLANVIPLLLADSPDPDSALNYLERLCGSAGQEVLRLLDRHHSLAHFVVAVFGCSQYLSETLLQNPDILQTLLREGNLDRLHSREEFREAFARFRSRPFETDISLLLARFKRREYIRIMLRDVLGLARLAETTAEISSLSDVLIEEALRECEAELHRKYGAPQHRDREGRLVSTPFAVLALGKLGGNELNYSSDIDLFFIYGDGEAGEDATITNREYFVRLGQQVTNALSQVTREGFVFRIDLRLRPQGREGEAAISLGQALEYYAEKAHDWECQAMIKVRYCAGDQKLARTFIRNVQERVYKEQVNFSAIETALAALDKMRGRKSLTREGEDAIDVKHHPGGIRDIEFLVQCLQRVYGGKEHWLRSGGTLFSLQKLHDKKHISGGDFHQLTTAYEFLRFIEHRLQLRQGQQTHRLPRTEHELDILARSLPHAGSKAYHGPELGKMVRERMTVVREIYDRVVHQHQEQSTAANAERLEISSEIEFGRLPTDHQVLMRLRSDNAALYEIATRTDLEPHTRRNLFKFLSSALTSSEGNRVLSKAPDAVARAVELFRRSEFLTDSLARHPEDVLGLRDLRASSTRHQDEAVSGDGDLIRGAYSSQLEECLASDKAKLSDLMALLRKRFRYRIFLSGARDVIESRPVFASLTDTTAAAEDAIRAAWAMAGRPPQLTVLAFGRLGTNEFDCLSDADLLFVRDEHDDPAVTARIAEDIVQFLSTYTAEGTVMPVDVRLRPHGGEGEIVVTLEKLEDYGHRHATSWEALTYTKLRWIAGNRELATRAFSAAESLRDRFASEPAFAAEIREMRSKLEQSDSNLKTGRGGLYDIDFITAFLTVRHRLHTAEGTTASRLQKLGQANILEKPDLQILLDALEFYRSLEHAIRLATGRAGKSLPVSTVARENVGVLVAQTGTRDLTSNLEQELASAAAKVREVFDRLIR